MKCVTRYYTSFDKPYPLTMYASNPLSTRATADHSRRYIRGGGDLDTTGDVIIQGLWESKNDAIIDVIFGYSDVDTYKYEIMDKFLYFWDK